MATATWGSGNVRDARLVDIWERAAPMWFNRGRGTESLWGYCASCYYADVCKGGCTWTSEALLGKPGNNPMCHHRALEMQRAGWIMPIDTQAADRRVADPWLLTTFWVASISYAAFNGLMYGVRSALFMDVTTPAVAATQFTAYMAMLNFAISYSARWQGWAVERWGYPITLGIDAIAGLLCLALLPLMTLHRARAPEVGAAIPEAVQP